MIDRIKFFNSLKFTGLFTKISQPTVDGVERILDHWEANCSIYTDIRWLAYMLATTYHETAKTMRGIEEYGKGKNRKYGKKLKMSGLSYSIPDEIYYGRGLVQLTWYENYELMGRLLHVNLLNYPQLALDPKICVAILFEGMTKGSSSFGDFTGRSLEQYFNMSTNDPLGARKIINGKDKDSLIVTYHNKFLIALS